MSGDIASVLVAALHDHDDSRPRSRQTRLGPSAIGGCRKQAWLRLQGIAPVQETSRLAAIIGTAIHASIEKAFRRLDPFGERYEIELEVEHDGVLGHVDLYDRHEETLTDWKSTTLRGMKHFPSDSQVKQVQAYGALLEASGRPVKFVQLVAIPRDGTEGDIRVWRDEYRPAVAEVGFRWLREVEDATVEPAPEKSGRFCEEFCAYFGPESCLGM